MNPAQKLVLRRATVFDVFQMSRVLIRSITHLCAADHGNDPRLVSLWTANKDPQSIRGRIQSGSELWVAELADQIAAVGGVRQGTKVSLLYVDPGYIRRGIGRALLARLEQELADQGCLQASLEATHTARAFYLRFGWVQTGASEDWHGMTQFPMRKSLHPTKKG
ncbi:GNAT family N-acetyltransferase [Ruegeria sp. SCPT10]|uniref:GNAT family N-acetyltransferase n=1 Tax=Ruegeria sp. SCP10 TaxID=3141377 RepID=UPI003339CE79